MADRPEMQINPGVAPDANYVCRNCHGCTFKVGRKDGERVAVCDACKTEIKL